MQLAHFRKLGGLALSGARELVVKGGVRLAAGSLLVAAGRPLLASVVWPIAGIA